MPMVPPDILHRAMRADPAVAALELRFLQESVLILALVKPAEYQQMIAEAKARVARLAQPSPAD